MIAEREKKKEKERYFHINERQDKERILNNSHFDDYLDCVELMTLQALK